MAAVIQQVDFKSEEPTLKKVRILYLFEIDKYHLQSMEIPRMHLLFIHTYCNMVHTAITTLKLTYTELAI